MEFNNTNMKSLLPSDLILGVDYIINIICSKDDEIKLHVKVILHVKVNFIKFMKINYVHYLNSEPYNQNAQKHTVKKFSLTLMQLI